ncbi:uncharacterized protein Fot_55543 [Forsythia ovata]|uniref:Uncharacterized protein n=1 Tax=Forsythia ovata TaxID=205694 RepID=A0ABD1P6L7_9LAMI
MSSILNSQGLVVVTAMAISAATMILFDHFRVKHLPENQDSTSDKQVLKSCLSLGGSKEREKMKKKRVQFADDVKDSSGNRNSCKSKALYSGILKGCVQRIDHHSSMYCALLGSWYAFGCRICTRKMELLKRRLELPSVQ